ncbi:MAG: DoxX family protein [Myxococcota bacterium]
MANQDHTQFEHPLDQFLSVSLAMLFAIAGLGKLFFFAPIYDQFIAWDFAPWVMPVIGIGEVLGALLILRRRSTVFGSAMLGMIMVGAVATHLGDSRPLIAIIPITAMVGLFTLAFRAHRPESFVRVQPQQPSLTLNQ